MDDSTGFLQTGGNGGIGPGGGLDGEAADHMLSVVGLGRWQVPHLFTLVLVQAVRSLHLTSSPLMNSPVRFSCSPSPPLSPPPPSSPATLLNSMITTTAATIIITTTTTNNNNINSLGSGGFDNQCLVRDNDNTTTTTTTFPTNSNNRSSGLLGPPSCPHVYYDDNVFQSTVMSEWHLVCDWDQLHPLFQVAFTLGSVFSSVFGGALSDRFGRRTMLCWSGVIQLPTTFLASFTMSFPLLLFLRFILGATTSISIIVVYTLVVEVFPPKYRSVAQCSSLFFGIAIVALGGLGYLLTAWRPLMLSLCVPAFFLIPPAFLMSRSPRWLVRRGRGREAGEVLRKAARLNRANPSRPALQSVVMKLSEVNEVRREALVVVREGAELRDVLSNPAMRTILFFAPVIGFTMQGLWLGTAFSANSFTSTSPQLYILCIGVSQTLGVALAVPLCRRVNRRVLLGGGYLVVVFLLVIILAVPEGMWWVRWSLVMAAHLAVASSYETSLLYSVELMPTFFRSRGGCFVHLFYLLGEAFMTLLSHTLTKRVGWWAVNVTLGVMAVVGGLSVFPLPETRNKPLPETLQDITNRSARQKTPPEAL